MANLNIYIRGTEQTTQVQQTQSTATYMSQANTPKSTPTPGAKSSVLSSVGRQGAMLGMYFLSQSLDYATSNIGNFTGDRQLQRNVNKAKEVIGYAVGFATAPILTSVMLATNIITNNIEESRSRYFNQIEINNALLRAGSAVGRKV